MVVEAGDVPDRGECPELRLAELARHEGDEFLLKGDVEDAHEQPWPEGPGRVVLVGDVEVVGHGGGGDQAGWSEVGDGLLS